MEQRIQVSRIFKLEANFIIISVMSCPRQQEVEPCFLVMPRCQVLSSSQIRHTHGKEMLEKYRGNDLHHLT